MRNLYQYLVIQVFYTCLTMIQLKSPYQDGLYAYAIIGGSGTGNNIVSPIFIVVDTENVEDFYKYYKP